MEALAGLSSPSDHFGLQFDQQGLVLCPPSLAIRTTGKAATTELPEAQQQKARFCSNEPRLPRLPGTNMLVTKAGPSLDFGGITTLNLKLCIVDTAIPENGRSVPKP